MRQKAATSEPDAGVSRELDGFGASKGRDEGTLGVAVNPRERTVQVLADAVLLALRSGDLVAARATATALEVFVEALGNAEPHTVEDIGVVRRNRDRNAR